jgi:hypothetical protein
MSHIPVDHPLRGLYRGLSLVSGLVLAVFGAVAFAQTASNDFLDTDGPRVLGLTANPAFGVFCLVVGVIVVAATLIGRNADVAIDRAAAVVLWIVATVGLCTLRTHDLNVLSFSVTNVNVLYVIGAVLFTAGLYVSTARATPVRRPLSERV